MREASKFPVRLAAQPSFAGVLNQYRGQRVVVTGATGFLGYAVSLQLVRAGADLVVLVRDATRLKPELGVARIVEIDLSRLTDVEDALTGVSPAIVFNLAGYGVDRRERDAARAERLNAELPLALVRGMRDVAANSWSRQRIVHTGSALEYGACRGDLVENSVPAPTTLYGRTKLAGTMALRECSRSLSIPSVTARLFSVYGQGEHPGRLLPGLIEAAKTGKRLDLTSGEQLRDFTWVDDVAEGLLRLGIADAEPGEIINLATGRQTSVRHFVEIAAEILGIPAELLAFGAMPTRSEEMTHDPVSVHRLRTVTAWIPSTTIRAGIEQTIRSVGE